MGVVIAVTSGKGGTGKTSISGGVASCLAALGHKTLCLDADVGLRNLDITLGLSDKAAMSFYDVLEGNSTLERAAVSHPKIPELYLLTAPVNILPEQISELKMSLLVDEIREKFEYCFIDAPAGIGAGFYLSAAFADKVIVVSTNDASSLRDVQKTVENLDDMNIESKYLIVNRIVPKIFKALAETIDDAMDQTGLPLLGIVPEDNSVILSANQGQPLILSGKTRAGVAFLNIAKRLEGKKVKLMKIR